MDPDLKAKHDKAAAARRGSDCQMGWHDQGLGHVCGRTASHNLPHKCTVLGCNSVFPPAFAMHADDAVEQD